MFRRTQHRPMHRIRPRAFRRSEVVVLAVVVAITTGGLLLQRRTPAAAKAPIFPSAQQCEQSRAGLVIAIDAYRDRFEAAATPTVADLMRQRLIAARPSEYLFAYPNGLTPRFFAISGSRCEEHP